MVSVGVLNDNCSTLGRSHALKEEEAFVNIWSNELVIRVSLLHMMTVVVMMLIVVVVVVATTEGSHLS